MKNYTILDESYNEPAKLFATLVKMNVKMNVKLKELYKKVMQANERLNLYIRNSFWINFDTNKHSTIIDEDNICFFYLKDVSELKIKFNDLLLDRDDYFNNLFNHQYMEQVMSFDDFLLDENESQEEYNEKKLLVDFIQKNIKKPLFKSKLTKQQHKTINSLTNKCHNSEDKRQFALAQLEDMQDDYNQFYESLIAKLIEDEHYDFDKDLDEIMIAKNKKTDEWNIVFYDVKKAN